MPVKVHKGEHKSRFGFHRLSHYSVDEFTFDNGKEFAAHEQIAETTGIAVYFAHPYSSYERGTNENTNGLIRQYFPKKCDLSRVSKASVKEVQNSLNHRPRKVLGFKTPYEVHFGKFLRYFE